MHLKMKRARPEVSVYVRNLPPHSCWTASKNRKTYQSHHKILFGHRRCKTYSPGSNTVWRSVICGCSMRCFWKAMPHKCWKTCSVEIFRKATKSSKGSKPKEAEKMLKWLQKVFNVSADGNICQADGLCFLSPLTCVFDSVGLAVRVS